MSKSGPARWVGFSRDVGTTKSFPVLGKDFDTDKILPTHMLSSAFWSALTGKTGASKVADPQTTPPPVLSPSA